MLIQLFGLLGAALVLTAYALLAFKRLAPTDAIYHALNGVGAGILVVVAVAGRQVGFIVLNAVWTVIALHGLWSATRARRHG